MGGGAVRPCRHPDAMTARVTRAILRHDAVTDAALWARLCGGSLTMTGNRRLKIYGRLGCPAGRRMHRSSRVFLTDTTAAEAAGYRLCARCCRAAYDVWKLAVNSGIQGTWSRSSSG